MRLCAVRWLHCWPSHAAALARHINAITMIPALGHFWLFTTETNHSFGRNQNSSQCIPLKPKPDQNRTAHIFSDSVLKAKLKPKFGRPLLSIAQASLFFLIFVFSIQWQNYCADIEMHLFGLQQQAFDRKKSSRMCGNCEACTRTEDCAQCDFCKVLHQMLLS